MIREVAIEGGRMCRGGRSAQDLADAAVVIPALNEEEPLQLLLPRLKRLGVGQIVVADNGSTDDTAGVAERHGCTLARAAQRGYGAACAAGIAAVRPEQRVIVFLDADLSDEPERIAEIAGPVVRGEADLVIGCRVAALRERGAMTPPQRFGNWLATRLIRLGWGFHYRDLGPFRAISAGALHRIGMRDRAYGWTVEMQVRAVELGLRIQEVPVPYRRRLGRSKISGTFRGVFLAAYYILSTLARLYCRRRV